MDSLRLKAIQTNGLGDDLKTERPSKQKAHRKESSSYTIHPISETPLKRKTHFKLGQNPTSWYTTFEKKGAEITKRLCTRF